MTTHPLNTMSKGFDEYITPEHILRGLGHFDLDPCSPKNPPRKIADRIYTKEDNGLVQEWNGRVWMNPPYGRSTQLWLCKLSKHGNGIALIFARTDTNAFHDHVFEKADAVLFIKGRISFENVEGEVYPHNSGAPSCLVAYGAENRNVLNQQKGGVVVNL